MMSFKTYTSQITRKRVANEDKVFAEHINHTLTQCIFLSR